MLYCEYCGYLYEGAKCPLCLKARGREPREDDPCFVAEKGPIESEMLADLLKQNGIPSLKKSVSGAALAVYTGRMLESFRIFVRYSEWEKACEIEQCYFGAAGGEALQDEETDSIPDPADGNEEEEEADEPDNH